MVRSFRSYATGLTAALLLLLLAIGLHVSYAGGTIWNGARGGGPATAPAAPTPTAVPGGPGQLFLGPADFTPSSSQDQFDRPNANEIEPGQSMAGIDLAAPVHLPPGTAITQVTIYYRDTDPATRPSAGLWQSQLDSLTLLAPLDPALPPVAFADGLDTRSVSVDGARVANASASYAVLVTLNRDPTDPRRLQQLYGVRVDYAYLNTLPTVQR